MTIRVYVAAAYGERERATNWAEELRALNFEIVSTWHYLPLEVESELTEARRATIVRDLCADIARADVVVALTWCGHPRATYAECGMAIGLGKPVLFVQHGSLGRMIFDSHPKAARFDLAARNPSREVLCDVLRKMVLL